MKPDLNKIYQGHVFDIIKEWDANIIDMCVTSPPYWMLRSYHTNPQIWGGDPDCKHEWNSTMTNGLTGGPPTEKMITKGEVFQRVPPTKIADCSLCGAWRGELGQEQNYSQFVLHLCDIFDEVKRILTPHGTLWVNLGDSHFGTKGKINKLASKCLVGIPFRFAIEMMNRGWILRNTIIWHKISGMPESCTDRFTNDFEYIFLFSKRSKYYFKQQFEPLAAATIQRMKYQWCSENTKASGYQDLNGSCRPIPYSDVINPWGRNKRAVWSNIKPSNYKNPHFAVFPSSLLESPIDAGCPREVCTKCGKPREFVAVREKVGGTKSKGKYEKSSVQGNLQCKKVSPVLDSYWTKCDCEAPFRKGVVFDPFMGSGTTALVALKNNKNFLGTDLNSEYVQMAYKRIKPFLKNRKIDEWLKRKINLKFKKK